MKPNWDLSKVLRETLSVNMKHTGEHGVYTEDSTSNDQVVIVQEVSTGPPSLFLFSFFMMIIKIIRRLQRCSEKDKTRTSRVEQSKGLEYVLL